MWPRVPAVRFARMFLGRLSELFATGPILQIAERDLSQESIEVRLEADQPRMQCAWGPSAFTMCRTQRALNVMLPPWQAGQDLQDRDLLRRPGQAEASTWTSDGFKDSLLGQGLKLLGQ